MGPPALAAHAVFRLFDYLHRHVFSVCQAVGAGKEKLARLLRFGERRSQRIGRGSHRGANEAYLLAAFRTVEIDRLGSSLVGHFGFQ